MREVVDINSKQTSYTVALNFMSYLSEEERQQYTGFNVTGIPDRDEAVIGNKPAVGDDKEVDW